MRHDVSKRAAFLAALGRFNCQTADEFLDLPKLRPQLPDLLPGAGVPSTGQLVLALRAVDAGEDDGAAKALLLRVADQASKSFPAALRVSDILQGKPSEPVILTKIGLGKAAAVSTDKKANLDLDRDGKNETYVEPMPGQRGRCEMADTPILKRPPPATDKFVLDLSKGSEVQIIGQIDAVYAIVTPMSANNEVGFVDKAAIVLT